MNMEAPIEDQRIPIEDAKLAIEIFKKALEYRPQIKAAIVGGEYLALSNEERIREMLTPRIGLTYADEKKTIPFLFFRFVGDESPVVEAFFYPYEAILGFLSEARARAHLMKLEGAEIEKFAFSSSIEMSIIMIDSFYQRAELMMDSFTMEVIAEWRRQKRQNTVHYHAERGNILNLQKETGLENAVQGYAKNVLRLWKYQGQTYENWQKIRLAEEYDEGGIYKHWKRLSKLVSEDEDWQEYAKAGKFGDTPDDLLDKLKDLDRRNKVTTEHRVSELAIEHAARRATLIKKTSVSNSILERRKKGVKVTGYSSGQLFEYLKEGRNLVAKLEAQRALMAQEKGGVLAEQENESAQMEKAKSLEQKIDFIQAESEKPSEQNGDSAQEKPDPK